MHAWLELVNQSPDAVGQHDKQAWLGIFASTAIVEDPVGSLPHTGGKKLSTFYDCFIAPNQISFHPQADYVCDNHVMRDLSLRIQMSEKVIAEVPMHLLYEITRENDQAKISRLAAHWEIMPMNMQLIGKGLPAIPVLMRSFGRMLKLLGLKGTCGFMRGMLMLKERDKQIAEAFFTSLASSSKNSVALNENFSACLQNSPHQRYNFEELKEILSGTFTLTKTIVSGYSITCSYQYHANNDNSIPSHQGVALLRLDPETGAIEALTFYQ